MLKDRGKSHHQSQKTVYMAHQKLTPEQENALVSWLKHQDEIDLPFFSKDIHTQATEISGKKIRKR